MYIWVLRFHCSWVYFILRGFLFIHLVTINLHLKEENVYQKRDQIQMVQNILCTNLSTRRQVNTIDGNMVFFLAQWRSQTLGFFERASVFQCIPNMRNFLGLTSCLTKFQLYSDRKVVPIPTFCKATTSIPTEYIMCWAHLQHVLDIIRYFLVVCLQQDSNLQPSDHILLHHTSQKGSLA